MSILFNLDTSELRVELKHGTASDGLVRRWSKYSMGAKRISHTPSAFINGVEVDNGQNMNKEDWEKLINSLISWKLKYSISI